MTRTGRRPEALLTAGQTAGAITEILPVAEIMLRLIAETEAALSYRGRRDPVEASLGQSCLGRTF